MAEFKFWIEVERFDEERDEYFSCTGEDEIFIEPVSLGVVECDEQFAVDLAESFDFRGSDLLKKRAAQLRKDRSES